MKKEDLDYKREVRLKSLTSLYGAKMAKKYAAEMAKDDPKVDDAPKPKASKPSKDDKARAKAAKAEVAKAEARAKAREKAVQKEDDDVQSVEDAS